MPIYSLTEERVEELQKQLKERKQEYDKLEQMHIHKIWIKDLEEFEVALDVQYEQEREAREAVKEGKGGKGKGGRTAKGKTTAGAPRGKRAGVTSPAPANTSSTRAAGGGDKPKKQEAKQQTL